MEKIKLTKAQWDKLNSAIAIANTAMIAELGDRHPEWKAEVEKASLVLTNETSWIDA